MPTFEDAFQDYMSANPNRSESTNQLYNYEARHRRKCRRRGRPEIDLAQVRDTELALLAEPGGAARPDRSGLHPPGNRTGRPALSRVPLTYVIQLVILAGNDPRLSRQEDAGVRRRSVGQGFPEFRKPSGETAGHPERRAFARYPAVLAGKPPRSAQGRQNGPVLQSHQSAVETTYPYVSARALWNSSKWSTSTKLPARSLCPISRYERAGNA